MIDPLHSLAFSIQSNPRVYAVLIGSGVSRAAGIPTGWDVTLDLIRKLATVRKEEPKPDPETWFRTNYETEPDYSELLDWLAKTPAERQQLLRAYWEPSEDEREHGLKTPTAAHRAIATLASRGFIKIIVTTNFDRLMEQALSAEGIEATVLSTPDQIDGAPPLDHIRHCVFKVHGDYLDPRIRNTPAELTKYPPQVVELLHRIFDEYGLIVCGWSGHWDPALRAALERASSRRYTTYWTTRSRPSESAQRLITHRRAERIRIEDADTFFDKVAEDVTAIDEFSKPHPLTVDVAVTRLKRYMAEHHHRIRFADLINDTVQEVVEAVSQDTFSPSAPEPTPESTTRRVRAYDAACSKLTTMALVGGTWAVSEHYPVWERALERLSRTGVTAGIAYKPFWLSLQRYPATLLLYALGLGAVDAQRFDFLKALLAVKIRRRNDDDIVAIGMLPPFFLLADSGGMRQRLKEMENRHTPLNDWIHDVLRQQAKHVFHDDARFTQVFDRLEVLLALGSMGVLTGWEAEWTPIGCFYWRGHTRDRFLAEIRESMDTEEIKSLFVKSGICGNTPEDCRQHIETLESKIEEIGWDVRFKLERMRRTKSAQ